MYYGGISPLDYPKMPVYMVRWIVERINKEIESASKANSQPASKAPHHNSPDVRALSGKVRSMVPSKLQRFT